MGLFDSVMGAVTGQLAQQAVQQVGLSSVLGDLLANNGALGGLSGLVDKFNQAGLAPVIASWIGNSENLPISAQQIASVLGSGPVAQLAGQLGIDPQQASVQLAQMLPGLIDSLTPHGVAPQDGLGHAGDLLGILGGLLHKS